MYAGGKIYKKRDHVSSRTDNQEEFINTARETVNSRGLQLKNNWSNIGNPMPLNFEPLLMSFLGTAGVKAMEIHRKKATRDLFAVTIPSIETIPPVTPQVKVLPGLSVSRTAELSGC